MLKDLAMIYYVLQVWDDAVKRMKESVEKADVLICDLPGFGHGEIDRKESLADSHALSAALALI